MVSPTVKGVSDEKAAVSCFVGSDSDVYGIEVGGWREEGVLVDLCGEFDRRNLEELRGTLDGVIALRRPIVVDLSGVTFLDIGATRELTIRSRLYAHRLTLRNPSWQVRRSVAACGFEDWYDFCSVSEDPSCRCHHPEWTFSRKIIGRSIF
jgi:anti-anti-sigma regulatory factor